METPETTTENTELSAVLAALKTFESRLDEQKQFNAQVVEVLFGKDDDEDEGEDDEDDDEDEGEDEGEGDGESHDMASIEQLIAFEVDKRLNAHAKANQAAIEFSRVEEGIVSQAERIVELEAQLAAVKLSASQGNTRAAGAGSESKVNLFSRDGEITEFGELVTAIQLEKGVSSSKAVLLAQKQNPALHREHLKARGLIA